MVGISFDIEHGKTSANLTVCFGTDDPSIDDLPAKDGGFLSSFSDDTHDKRP